MRTPSGDQAQPNRPAVVYNLSLIKKIILHQLVYLWLNLPTDILAVARGQGGKVCPISLKCIFLYLSLTFTFLALPIFFYSLVAVQVSKW